MSNINQTKKMLISVVITTKNEEKNLGNCLESVKNQTYPQKNIEIIVVDNNSTDRTKKIASRYTNKIFNQGPERSVQRNFGVSESKGDWFIFLDADMILSENVLKECVEKIENYPEISALYIPEIISGKSFWNKIRNFERSFYNGTVIDCARFIRKKSFQQVGGFDENLTGPEDWDLDKKIKKLGKIEITKNPLYHNEEKFCLKNYLKKKAYYGQYFKKYIEKWGKEDLDVQKQFGFYYRFLGVFIENGKWKKILAHPLLFGGTMILRVLVGFNFLIRKF